MIKCNLKAISALQGIQQQELVKTTGIRQATLSALNNNRELTIGINNLNRLCSVLHCQPGDLFTFIPDSDADV